MMASKVTQRGHELGKTQSSICRVRPLELRINVLGHPHRSNSNAKGVKSYASPPPGLHDKVSHCRCLSRTGNLTQDNASLLYPEQELSRAQLRE